MSEVKTLKERQNTDLFSSFISHHSSLPFKKRFMLIELLVNSACFTGGYNDKK